ncbi:hypothetical protein HPA99_05495 [Streptococcus suis]|nr:hypothetical protein [Streptococcus suis]
MKKMINYSLILLSVTCLMTACASKTQETQTKTSTSKTTQSSTKKSSSASSSKAEKTQENKSEQTSSSQSETSNNNATNQSSTASETQASTTTNSQAAETNQAQINLAAITYKQIQTLPSATIPPAAIGQWKGTSQQARNIDMSLSADGTITVTNDFRTSEDQPEENNIFTYTARITDLVEYSPNHYLIRGAEGEYSALLPGMTGLGGRITPGFILEDGQYKVVMWGNPYDSSIEAKYDLVSEPHVFVSLEKVE